MVNPGIPEGERKSKRNAVGDVGRRIPSALGALGKTFSGRPHNGERIGELAALVEMNGKSRTAPPEVDWTLYRCTYIENNAS